MILLIQKCQVVPHNKLLSITLRACYHLRQMTAVVKGNGKSVISRQEEHLLGGRNARCWIVVPRNVQQIHQAKIRMLPLDLLDAFCPTHFVGYLNNLMSDPGIWKCLGKPVFRKMRLFHQDLVATGSLDFDSKLDDWNQMHFCRHILLAISTTSCLILEFESVLESVHSGKCDCSLRIWWQRVLAISIPSWMTETRCIFANTICWLFQRPHVWSWNLKVSWKVCIQANATVSSEFGGNVFSRFQFQVGWLEPDAFLPTHFVGYLINLKSDLGIWSVLESVHSGKCNCFLRIWWQRVLAISIPIWMTGTRCIFADPFCWLFQRPHVWSWNLKVCWNACIQANATVSSELGGNVFLRFQLQVGWMEPEALWPTLYSYLATEKTTYIVTKQQMHQHT
jgi:hypothetical protein